MLIVFWLAYVRYTVTTQILLYLFFKLYLPFGHPDFWIFFFPTPHSRRIVGSTIFFRMTTISYRRFTCPIGLLICLLPNHIKKSSGAASIWKRSHHFCVDVRKIKRSVGSKDSPNWVGTWMPTPRFFGCPHRDEFEIMELHCNRINGSFLQEFWKQMST